MRDVLVGDCCGARGGPFTGGNVPGPAAVLASLCAVLAARCAAALAPPAAAAADRRADHLHVAFLNEVDSFNPFLGHRGGVLRDVGAAYDYLVGYSMEDMSPEPALATEWETSDDGLTWTFTMRDDVTWSDGEPLTAQDVAYTYGRILDGGPRPRPGRRTSTAWSRSRHPTTPPSC